MSELLERTRSRIEALGIGFQFVKPIKTSMNGIERETWILEYEGSHFVFVAGQKNVTLGWDVDKCPLKEGLLEELREEFSEGQEYYRSEIEDLREDFQKQIEAAQAEGDFEKVNRLCSELAEEMEWFEETMEENGYRDWEHFMAKWNTYLSECLSPLRTADIGDMIVEVDSRYLDKDALSLEEAVCSLKGGTFTLATEDEWEYLCNGGARSLFRWGDTLGYVLEEIYNVGAVTRVEEKPILEQPNMFGLLMAYNSYKMEIIDHTKYVKGGDGGGSLCGGDGAIHVLPCYTAFYRHTVNQTYALSKNYYSYRRIVRLG